MKNVFKLSLLALIAAFLLGCGSSSGGNEQGETEKRISAFMADFIFSDFNSGAVKPIWNSMSIYYDNVSEADAVAFRDALVVNKGFSSLDGFTYYPSDKKGFQSAEAYIDIIIGGGNTSFISLILDNGNKSIAYSDFDLMFGDINLDVIGFDAWFGYEIGVDMSAVFDAHYAKLIADGKIEASDCNNFTDGYYCAKNGQDWYAFNDVTNGSYERYGRY